MEALNSPETLAYCQNYTEQYIIRLNPIVHTLSKIITYCNKFAGSISGWKFITLTVQYTTVDYRSQLLLSSNTSITSTGSLI
jgi:hypothetical protein